MYYFSINKSGKTIPVYNDTVWESTTKQIGVLYDREAFAFDPAEGDLRSILAIHPVNSPWAIIH